MSTTEATSILEIEPDFDPLFEEEPVLDAEVIDDDNSNDIEEMPFLPNMPEGVITQGIYDASNYDHAQDAIRALIERNPGRRPVYLSIIDLCKQGMSSTDLAAAIDALQAENRSVYSPMTLCKALERAGALTVEIPESSEAVETEEGTNYLVIKEQVDPTWTSTKEGLDILQQEREGRAFKELFELDSNYLFMYEIVLSFVAERPRSKSEIDLLVDNDPRVQDPRRYSNHFIELLESADALAWKKSAWTITNLGREALAFLSKKQ